MIRKPREPLVIPAKPDNKKKLYFTDEGGVEEKSSKQLVIENGNSTEVAEKKHKSKKNFQKNQKFDSDVESKWYHKFEEHNVEEFIDIKESELKAFQELCKRCYNDEVTKLRKSKILILYKFQYNELLFIHR
jgi:hypothetical protein